MGDKILTDSKGLRYRYATPEDTTNLYWTVNVNLTPKMVRTAVPDTEKGVEIKNVYLWDEEKSIKGLVGDDVIFEVGNRSKAFKELSEYTRHKWNVRITERQGDYGIYYWVRLEALIVKMD